MKDGKSKTIISQNIRELVAQGMTHKAAVIMAMQKAGIPPKVPTKPT
jgi:hypothetical protein